MIRFLYLGLLLCSLPGLCGAEEKENVYRYQVTDIEGKEIDLADYKSKVLLIVNVASQCGVTSQYATLQALHSVLKDRDFVVMGFPSNEFGGQEPGTNEEIATFCRTEYQVTFPMMAKAKVKNGEDQLPLFGYLTKAENPDQEGDIGWNFEKFLVGKDGRLLRRFPSHVEPDDPIVIDAIKKALEP